MAESMTLEDFNTKFENRCLMYEITEIEDFRNEIIIKSDKSTEDIQTWKENSFKIATYCEIYKNFIECVVTTGKPISELLPIDSEINPQISEDDCLNQFKKYEFLKERFIIGQTDDQLKADSANLKINENIDMKLIDFYEENADHMLNLIGHLVCMAVKRDFIKVMNYATVKLNKILTMQRIIHEEEIPELWMFDQAARTVRVISKFTNQLEEEKTEKEVIRKFEKQLEMWRDYRKQRSYCLSALDKFFYIVHTQVFDIQDVVDKQKVMKFLKKRFEVGLEGMQLEKDFAVFSEKYTNVDALRELYKKSIEELQAKIIENEEQ